MKTKILVTGLSVLLAGSVWAAPQPLPVNVLPLTVKQAVPTPSFAYFRTHRQGRNGATADWGLITNNGVTSFVVQRTYEDPYDPYAMWDDVCGLACGNSRSFKHTDTNLFPGYISYRVVAMNGSTAVAVSEISTIRILQH